MPGSPTASEEVQAEVGRRVIPQLVDCDAVDARALPVSPGKRKTALDILRERPRTVAAPVAPWGRPWHSDEPPPF